eukprot:jgi/Chrzof1/1010/Cz01g37010.t1
MARLSLQGVPAWLRLTGQPIESPTPACNNCRCVTFTVVLQYPPRGRVICCILVLDDGIIWGLCAILFDMQPLLHCLNCATLHMVVK